MTEYNAPVKDMKFALRELSSLDEILNLPAFADIDDETVDQVLEEAGRFAKDVLAPLNIPGDQSGCHIKDKAVVVADGFQAAYQQFVENGWQSLPAATDFGGMGFPEVAGAATLEMWQSANLAFALCPMLTASAVVALEAHGSDELKSRYLPGLVSGEISGTMNLTEPQAGSDLSAITTTAAPVDDHFLVSGTKIFITWGDHPMAENILHLVLARLPDAPSGIRGMSLFAVPKFLSNEDGSRGERNDVHPASVEHKLGIHASPTCVMTFGDSKGAVGYLVGEANKGIACMFTMMNHARINVGIQGVAICERAYQLAKSFALERVQGGVAGREGKVTIINHADIRRMLMIMKSQTEAMRAAAYFATAQLDLGHSGIDAVQRDVANSRAALLTPVIKGWATEVAQEVTSLGVQIHGGMGYVEETGAAQYLRDARILPIYEGTTGIQANDFVGRKVLGDEGRAMRALIQDMRATTVKLSHTAELERLQAPMMTAIDELSTAVDWVLDNATVDPNVPAAAAVNLLMLAGTVLGGWQMARASIAVADSAAETDSGFRQSKLLTVRFYIESILPRASYYQRAAMAGPESVMAMPEELF